jgi:hypothetical protein
MSLVDLERKRVLIAYAPDEVGYSHPTNRRGPRAKWVYDEGQIAALAENVIRASSVVKRRRIEAQAFALLAAGKTLVDLVQELEIDVPTAKQIRDFYMHEKGGVFIPAGVVQELLDMNIRLTPENAPGVIMALIERVRVAEARCGMVNKPPPKHVRLIPKKKKR